MEILLPKKDYLSATRFAKAINCGLLGYHLSNEKLNIPDKVFERGKILHDMIDSYFQLGQDAFNIPKHMLEGMPDRKEVIPNREYTKLATYNNRTLKCIGTPDLTTSDKVYEFKSGSHSEWHIWQLAFYMWLMEKPYGKLMYFDHPELSFELKEGREKYIVNEEVIIKCWVNILLNTPSRSYLCSSCPIKKTCPEWKGKASEEMLDLVEMNSKKKELEEMKDHYMNNFLNPINEQLSEIKKKEAELRIKIAKENPTPNNYDIAGATISISKRKTIELPEDFVPPSYEQMPDIYKQPELDKKKATERFGIKVEKPTITIR